MRAKFKRYVAQVTQNVIGRFKIFGKFKGVIGQ
jgi:hypothetical protein